MRFIVESKEKNIYEITYLDNYDSRSFATVSAYSKSQAALLLKKKEGYKNVRRILSIDCIEDNSIDDEEQLSLF